MQTATANTGRIFVGIFPAGISYADRQREEHGEYKKLAFLSYTSLRLEWRDKSIPAGMREEIQRHADTIMAQRGGLFEVSSCGQTVRLGNK